MSTENIDDATFPEKIDYHELLTGKMPPWVMRFIKQTGKGINDFNMIKGGDTVLIAASGGKDSLALSLALSVRRRWLPVDYKIRALMINWIEHPIPEEFRKKLQDYYEALGIEFEMVDEHQFPESFKGEFNCYLCSRNRRRILFEYASKHDIRLIAMGHHLDDLVETTMMNLCFRANFATMQPVQEFFKGKLYVIRPMIEVHENTIKRIANAYDIPVIKPVCPYDQTNVRARLKPIIGELVHLDKLTREHIFNAHEFTCALPKASETPESVESK